MLLLICVCKKQVFLLCSESGCLRIVKEQGVLHWYANEHLLTQNAVTHGPSPPLFIHHRARWPKHLEEVRTSQQQVSAESIRDRAFVSFAASRKMQDCIWPEIVLELNTGFLLLRIIQEIFLQRNSTLSVCYMEEAMIGFQYLFLFTCTGVRATSIWIMWCRGTTLSQPSAPHVCD